MAGYVRNTLAVNLPGTAAYPQLSGPAVIGDDIEMRSELFDTVTDAPSGYHVSAGPLAQGAIEIPGAIPAGNYELREVRIRDSAGAGDWGAAGTVAVVIPANALALSSAAVANVNHAGGVAQAVVDLNATLSYAITPAGQSYANGAALEAAAGALASGSLQARADEVSRFPLFNGGQPETAYRAHFYARRDGFESPIVTVDFSTLAANTAMPGFASVSISAGGATNTRLVGTLTDVGDVWHRAQLASDPAPDEATIKAGGGIWSSNSSGIESFNVTLSGLSANQVYVVHSVALVGGVDSPIDARVFNTNIAATGSRRGRRVTVG